MNPYVFVVGCPRSGTTLLQRILDAHPQLAVIDETLWITRYHGRKGYVDEEGMVTRELLRALRAEKRFARLELDGAELERRVGGAVPYDEFVAMIFDLYGEIRGKPFVGDKSPGYVRSIFELHTLWPHVRFIHLIRDGRDVGLSALAWKKADRLFEPYPTWPDEPTLTAALWWERNVRLGREAAIFLPPGHYLEVRYEDLVSRADAECAAICSFLELPYDEAMLRFHEGRVNATPGLPTKRQWLPPMQGLRDWRTEMDAPELARFEAAAGALLEELGYPRGAAAPRDKELAEADAARRRLAQHALSRGRPLPEAWAA
jgi:Sulfotransferase family